MKKEQEQIEKLWVFLIITFIVNSVVDIVILLIALGVIK